MASSFNLLLFILMINSICWSAAQPNYRNMTAGTTLTPLVGPTLWSSPNGDFSFGFLPNLANSSLSLLCVYYTSDLPNRTIVWTANGPTPVPTAVSKLTLSSSGHLSLVDPTGQQIWSPNVTNISQVSIHDTGNLVLSGYDSTILWQSFDHPTDTILPGQMLVSDMSLISRMMDTDFSDGRFQLIMQSDGNLVFYYLPDETPGLQLDHYWSSGTVGLGSNVQLVYNESGNIYLAYGNGTVVSNLFTGTISDTHYHRATMDPDGVFRQYKFPKNELSNNRSWIVTQTAGSNICNDLEATTGSGACGFNSYCTMDPDDGRVACLCPPKYTFVDDAREYLGCKPDFVQENCQPGGEAMTFNFVLVPNLDWPLDDADLSQMNETECRTNCLTHCYCSVAIYVNGNCWIKKYPLSNGRLGTDVNRMALIKYSTVTMQNNDTGVGSNVNNTINVGTNINIGIWMRHWKIWIVMAALFLTSSILLTGVLLIVCKKRTLNHSMMGFALPTFTYRELEQATNGFANELGRGAFGTVYKGTIGSEPQILIAVKKLNCLGVLEEPDKDFENEIHSIGETHHKNLVHLLGFCKEGTHRLLVYEFMSNGSLHEFLFGDETPEWDLRTEIAVGIASGLAYLHEECRTQIIHCDIKPQNILLNDTFVARISDFGMAKLLRLDQTRTGTGPRGTMGYLAPEWFQNTGISAKVDVYSYGVMLLEIISCTRNWVLQYTQTESEVKPALAERAKKCLAMMRVDMLVKEMDEDAKMDKERLEKFVKVAIWCIQDEPWLRPTMSKVVQMLKGDVEVDNPPTNMRLMAGDHLNLN